MCVSDGVFVQQWDTAQFFYCRICRRGPVVPGDIRSEAFGVYCPGNPVGIPSGLPSIRVDEAEI